MYKDRGIIKWAPFDALVGFRGMIKEMLHNQNKIEKPVLTEDLLNEMNWTLEEALEFNKELQIDYYEDGYIKTLCSKVLKVDLYKQEIFLTNKTTLSLSIVTNLLIYN